MKNLYAAIVTITFFITTNSYAQWNPPGGDDPCDDPMVLCGGFGDPLNMDNLVGAAEGVSAAIIDQAKKDPVKGFILWVAETFGPNIHAHLGMPEATIVLASSTKSGPVIEGYYVDESKSDALLSFLGPLKNGAKPFKDGFGSAKLLQKRKDKEKIEAVFMYTRNNGTERARVFIRKKTNSKRIYIFIHREDRSA